MEWLPLLELCGFCIEGTNLIAVLVDLFAWVRGRPNRRERREAKETGVDRPPLDYWNWLVILLTPIVLVLTVFLLYRWFGPGF